MQDKSDFIIKSLFYMEIYNYVVTLYTYTLYKSTYITTNIFYKKRYPKEFFTKNHILNNTISVIQPTLSNTNSIHFYRKFWFTKKFINLTLNLRLYAIHPEIAYIKHKKNPSSIRPDVIGTPINETLLKTIPINVWQLYSKPILFNFQHKSYINGELSDGSF